MALPKVALRSMHIKASEVTVGRLERRPYEGGTTKLLAPNCLMR
jgi:hypothetical protein